MSRVHVFSAALPVEWPPPFCRLHLEAACPRASHSGPDCTSVATSNSNSRCRTVVKVRQARISPVFKMTKLSPCISCSIYHFGFKRLSTSNCKKAAKTGLKKKAKIVQNYWWQPEQRLNKANTNGLTRFISKSSKVLSYGFNCRVYLYFTYFISIKDWHLWRPLPDPHLEKSHFQCHWENSIILHQSLNQLAMEVSTRESNMSALNIKFKLNIQH